MTIKEPTIISSPQMDNPSQPLEVKTAADTLLQNLLNGSLILGTILFFINVYTSLQTTDYYSVVLTTLAFAVIFLITFVRTLPYHVRVSILSAGYYIIGFISLIRSGLNANALLYFVVSILIVALLEQNKYWLYPFSLVALTVLLVGFLIQNNIIRTGNFIVQNNSFLFWVSVSVNFLYLVFMLTLVFTQFFQKLSAEIVKVFKKNSELFDENQVLASKLVDFENTLDRRRSRLVTTRQISRELAQQSDLDKLLHDSVDLIRSQLGYYHAGIFLADEHNENALLRAATGEAGRVMLERKHRLRIRDEGIVGYVISRGEPRIALDVSDDSVHYKNPALPNTRSEIAVPLRVGTRIFGALDVQSDQIEAFGEEDIEVLQSIADQLSMAIDKTTQIQQLNQKVNDLEEGYRSYTRGVWQTHLRGSKKQLSYVYKQDTLGTDLEKSEISEDALLKGEPVVSPSQSGETAENIESELAVPITLRNQVLGVLNIKCTGKTVPNELVALINNASDRLALALENARLLEQIQERAEREHLVGEISTKVRTAVDIDSILRTTASELGKSLGIDEVRIQLKSAE